MSIITIFTILLPQEFIKLTEIIINKTRIILPESFTESFTELLSKLVLSQEEFLTLLASLLALYGITVLLCILRRILAENTSSIIDAIEETLLSIISTLFLSVLLYNSMYPLGISLFSLFLISGHPIFILFSFFLFLIAFSATYFSDVCLIFQRINNSDLSTGPKIIANAIFWIIILWLIDKIFLIL